MDHKAEYPVDTQVGTTYDKRNNILPKQSSLHKTLMKDESPSGNREDTKGKGAIAPESWVINNFLS